MSKRGKKWHIGVSKITFSIQNKVKAYELVKSFDFDTHKEALKYAKKLRKQMEVEVI